MSGLFFKSDQLNADVPQLPGCFIILGCFRRGLDSTVTVNETIIEQGTLQLDAFVMLASHCPKVEQRWTRDRENFQIRLINTSGNS